MKTMTLISVIAATMATAAMAGDRITLRDETTKKEYGPVDVATGSKLKIDGKTFVIETVKWTPEQQALEKKLKSIVIPSLTFQEAKIHEAVAYYVEQATKFDPQKKGVNIVVLGVLSDATAPKLSLVLKNASLYDALRYTAQATGLVMRIDDNAVVISH